MQRYPGQVASQQPILGPLQAIRNREPVCEAWIRLSQQIALQAGNLSPAALGQLSAVGRALGKVFGALQADTPQSFQSLSYLMTLEQTAWGAARNCTLLAMSAAGSQSVVLSQAANAALATLGAWDPVMDYPAPSHVGALGYALVAGITMPGGN